MKRAESDLDPATLQRVIDADPDFGRRLAWVVSSTLESDSLEVQVLGKFDHHPGSVMVRCVPLVPRLFARAKQILRMLKTRWSTEQHVMLCCHSCSRVQVIPKRAAHSLSQSTPASHSAVAKVQLDVDRLTIDHDAGLLWLLDLYLQLLRLVLGLLIILLHRLLLVLGLLLILRLLRLLLELGSRLSVLLRLHLAIHIILVNWLRLVLLLRLATRHRLSTRLHAHLSLDSRLRLATRHWLTSRLHVRLNSDLFVVCLIFSDWLFECHAVGLALSTNCSHI